MIRAINLNDFIKSLRYLFNYTRQNNNAFANIFPMDK